MDNMGETLFNKISEQPVDTNTKVKYLLNLVEGLSIMHQNNFFHCDITSNNILVDEDNIARFIDFGMSKLITNENNRWKASVSSPEWTAPNFVNLTSELNGQQLLNVDIYQLGLVFYFVLLEDKDFLAKRPTGPKSSDELYTFFETKVNEKITIKDDSYERFCASIMKFIKDNRMLNYEDFKSKPEQGSVCRMITIKQNFEMMLSTTS
jgi:serine/threonine protein kinase